MTPDELVIHHIVYINADCVPVSLPGFRDLYRRYRVHRVSPRRYGSRVTRRATLYQVDETGARKGDTGTKPKSNAPAENWHGRGRCGNRRAAAIIYRIYGIRSTAKGNVRARARERLRCALEGSLQLLSQSRGCCQERRNCEDVTVYYLARGPIPPPLPPPSPTMPTFPRHVLRSIRSPILSRRGRIPRSRHPAPLNNEFS